MKLDHTQRYLHSLGKEIVKTSKQNLKRGGKGGGYLEDSIEYEIVPFEDGFALAFSMASYGTFVDKGVKGAGGTIKSGRYMGVHGGRRWFVDLNGKRKDSPYKFGNKTGPIGGMRDGISSWVRKKQINRSSVTGKFISATGLKIAIMRVLWIRGIHGISFFQKSLYQSLKTLPDEFIENMAEDIIDTLTLHPRIFRKL
tara:strand:+ start:483 stop:1076 length:594 start_codon:yes stop_codon:yes gene_type:complete